MRYPRILYFSSQFPTRSNPHIGVFSVERVRALKRAGGEVKVVAPLLMTPPPGLVRRPLHLIQWLRQQARLPDYSRLGEIEVCSPKWLCPPKPVFGWYLSAFEYAQIRRAAMQAAAELRPQAILSSWLPDGVVACKLGERLDIPVLCIADGTDINEWPQKYPYWRYARDILNQKASALIYVSEALRRVGAARGLHVRNEVVIHNAVDIQVFKPGSDRQLDKTYSILAVGRMTQVKGLDILITAFSEFSRRLERPTRLVLVGDGDLRPTLQEQTNRLGIASKIQFAGVVAPDQMPAYYQAADLLCLPSYSEGLPCVAVEAMACGKPVVASRVGGVPEVIDAQSGIMVLPGDPQALCEAMLQAASRSWDAQAIRQKILDGFSSIVWTQQILDVIQSVIATPLVEAHAGEQEKAWPAWH